MDINGQYIMDKTAAIILAAGAGTRMKTDTPKVLHKVGSETILGKVISNLKKTEIHDIIVVVGYKAEQVKEHFKNEVRFAVQEQLLGSGDAVKEAIKQLHNKTKTVVICCGDAPLINSRIFDSLIKKHFTGNADCTLLTCHADDTSSYGRILRDKTGSIEKIVEEKDLSAGEKDIKEINAGTYCFSRTSLEKYIDKIEKNPVKKEYYLTDIVEILRRDNKKINSIECVYREVIGINSRKDITLVNKIIKKSTLEKLMNSGVTIIDPETTCIDEAAEIAQDTTIYPNTVIENDVIVGERCSIGPFARLRPGTKISDEVEIGNFVEICRTEIGDRTRIKHHTYLGDATVGSDVNIGAGTITANYDGNSKNRTVIEDGAFIGVGAILIAPVKVGKMAKIGAGSVVTKSKDVPAGETVVGVPAKPLKK